MQATDRITGFRRFIEAWTQGNLSAVDELMAPNVVYHTPPFPDFSGTEGLKQFISGFYSAFPNDLQVVFDEDLVAGDATAHRWNARGSFKGRSPLLAMEPTGRLATATGCHICHWSGDRCVEVWHFGDWLGWLQMAGAAPPLNVFESIGTFG
ncbi:MAG: ester cyclase [Acetobacteraceae bacterium]|nr:ester cyclase [Acetobacteraceae bacterium]